MRFVDAVAAIGLIASMTTTPRAVSDFAYLDIEPKSVCSRWDKYRSWANFDSTRQRRSTTFNRGTDLNNLLDPDQLT